MTNRKQSTALDISLLLPKQPLAVHPTVVTIGCFRSVLLQTNDSGKVQSKGGVVANNALYSLGEKRMMHNNGFRVHCNKLKYVEHLAQWQQHLCQD